MKRRGSETNVFKASSRSRKVVMMRALELCIFPLESVQICLEIIVYRQHMGRYVGQKWHIEMNFTECIPFVHCLQILHLAAIRVTCKNKTHIFIKFMKHSSTTSNNSILTSEIICM